MFGTDEALEKETGVVIDYGDFQIKILRAGGANSKYARVRQREYKKHKYAIDSGAMPDEVFRKIMITVYAEAVIIGWEGVRGKPTETAPDGEILPFTQENVITVLNDLPALFDDQIGRAHV